MGTEIHRQSVAKDMGSSTSVGQAANIISEIMSRERGDSPAPSPSQQARQHPVEDPDVIPDTPDPEDSEQEEDVEDPRDLDRVEAREGETESEQGRESPKKAEPRPTEEDAAEIELEPYQLAGLVGLDESDLDIDDDGGVGFKVKVDGEVSRVTLSDLRDGYQLRKASEQRLSKLGEERKALQQEREQALQNLTQQAEQMGSMIGVMQQEAAAEWQGTDWGKLREEDPTAYALKRGDFDDRMRRIEGYKSQYQEQMQKVSQEHFAAQQKAVEEGRAKLDEVFSGPEYADAPAWDQEAKKELRDFILSEGIPAELVDSTPVWQAFKWARDSMMYRKSLEAAKETKKKVVKLPKVLKPGSKQSKSAKKEVKRSDARARQIKAGGSMQATADRISEILRGS